MSAILLVNLCIFLRIIYLAFKSGKLIPSYHGVWHRRLVKLIITYTLAFNFGIPWALYILYTLEYICIGSGKQIFSIVFILVNGTQVIYNKKPNKGASTAPHIWRNKTKGKVDKCHYLK